jgi:hypothetical protein
VCSAAAWSTSDASTSLRVPAARASVMKTAPSSGESAAGTRDETAYTSIRVGGGDAPAPVHAGSSDASPGGASGAGGTVRTAPGWLERSSARGEYSVELPGAGGPEEGSFQPTIIATAPTKARARAASYELHVRPESSVSSRESGDGGAGRGRVRRLKLGKYDSAPRALRLARVGKMTARAARGWYDGVARGVRVGQVAPSSQ